MEVTVAKWGNSLGIRLPNSVIKNLGAKCGDKISIESTAGRAVIEKERDPWKEMEEYFGKPLSELTEQELRGSDVEIVDFGQDVGGEVVE